MNFCILIELSKERISFLYNRSDSDNGFVPFVEQGSLPLAIYCSGNQMEIGQFAIDEANKQNPNAFVDVFRKLRDGGTFKFRGEEIPNNMLLFTAIQRYLSSFFDNTLIGQMGRLEQNVATMPICFLFNADINENERLFVKDSFVKSGFANVGVRDCDQLAMRMLHTDCANYICVTGNGQDLFVNIYGKQGKRLESLILCNCGRDPRMSMAVDKLWDSIGYDNYYLNKDQELPILEQVAEDFLESGRISINESVTFSNGYSYDVALSLHELEQFAVKDDGKVIVDVVRKLAGNNIKVSDCIVILQGKAAQNSFFSNMFKKEFNAVKSIDNSLRAEMLATFLAGVKISHYRFTDKVSILVSDDEKDKKRQTSDVTNKIWVSPQHENSQEKEIISPTKRDERDFKLLRLEVKTCLANNEKAQALESIKNFLNRMHAKNIFAFDDDVEKLLKKQNESDGLTETPQMTCVPPMKRDERDMKMLRMDVDTYIHNGELNKVKPLVEAFRQRMNAKDVHAFDDELDAIEAQGSVKSINMKTTTAAPEGVFKPSKHQQSTNIKRSSQTLDEGTQLMRKEQFKEAREWFRANGLSNEADDCTTIIRWLRFLPAYEQELQSTIETKNREKARLRVKEIKDIVGLYDKYGVDVSRLKKLQNEYKKTK